MLPGSLRFGGTQSSDSVSDHKAAVFSHQARMLFQKFVKGFAHGSLPFLFRFAFGLQECGRCPPLVSKCAGRTRGGALALTSVRHRASSMHTIADLIGFCPDSRKLFALSEDGVVLESSPQFSADPGIKPYKEMQDTDPISWGFLCCKKAVVNPNWQCWFPCEPQLTLVLQEEIRWKTKTKIGYPYKCVDKHA